MFNRGTLLTIAVIGTYRVIVYSGTGPLMYIAVGGHTRTLSFFRCLTFHDEGIHKEANSNVKLTQIAKCAQGRKLVPLNL